MVSLASHARFDTAFVTRKLCLFAFMAVTGALGARSQGITNAVAPATPSAPSVTSSGTPTPSPPASSTAAPPASNSAPPPAAPAKRSAAELQKLAEPIALHPDDLIAIILPASVYPLEIVQAARFVKDTNNIPKVDQQPWDENVKAVAKFPDLIAKMDADLSWTISLGEAFVNQSKDLMDAIQSLRAMAQKAGNLKTSEQQIVTVTNTVVYETNLTEVVEVPKEIITIAPSDPAVVYVPSYPSAIYYPWYPYYGYAAPFISFGAGFAWGAFWGAAWNSCNWGGGHVDHHVDANRNVNRNVDRNRNTDRAQARDRGSNTRGREGGRTQQWKPDQNRMAENRGNRGNRDARGYGSGTGRSSFANSGARSSTGALGSRSSGGNAGTRPSTGVGSGAGSRPSAGNVSRSGSGIRPSATGRGSSSTYGGRSSSSSGRNSAFNRSSGSSGARSSSARGGSSRGGGGFSGGGRGGGGRGGGGGRR